MTLEEAIATSLAIQEATCPVSGSELRDWQDAMRVLVDACEATRAVLANIDPELPKIRERHAEDTDAHRITQPRGDVAQLHQDRGLLLTKVLQQKAILDQLAAMK